MCENLKDTMAKCPFFRKHTALNIYCESPIPDSGVKLTFADQDAKKRQWRIFCCAAYENCELYQPNMDKYEEEEE